MRACDRGAGGVVVPLLSSVLEEGPSDAALDTLNQFPAEAQAAFEDVLRSCGRPYRGEPEMTLYECRDGRLASE